VVSLMNKPQVNGEIVLAFTGKLGISIGYPKLRCLLSLLSFSSIEFLFIYKNISDPTFKFVFDQ